MAKAKLTATMTAKIGPVFTLDRLPEPGEVIPVGKNAQALLIGGGKYRIMELLPGGLDGRLIRKGPWPEEEPAPEPQPPESGRPH